MVFPEKYELIRKLARQFATTDKNLIRISGRIEETGVFPEEIIDKMAKEGLLASKCRNPSAVRAATTWHMFW
jgi:alkylation response protein AidB-like acyl-CoA dehydrogenase